VIVQGSLGDCRGRSNAVHANSAITLSAEESIGAVQNAPLGLVARAGH
jgi:hypothetical protein